MIFIVSNKYFDLAVAFYYFMKVMPENSKKPVVAVAMSGGVDSSVAAALLVSEGFVVIGVTMMIYKCAYAGGSIGGDSSCCGVNAIDDARIVASKLGIPHYVVDVSDRFTKIVIDNFVEEYRNGKTPNPCVVCNAEIKWGELLRKTESLGAEYFATGHYARVRHDEITGRYIIKKARDSDKDQTYALWRLRQDVLKRTIFPLGEYTKPEVRAIASRYGLKTAGKEESFEICFIADNDYRRFLVEQFEKACIRVTPGDLFFGERIVGKHDGIPFYTVGQRSGIGSYGERVYVTEIDKENNIVRIGRNVDLQHKGLIAHSVNLMSAERFEDNMRIQAMVRYKDNAAPALLFSEPNGRIRVLFDEPKRAVTPGQSIAMYDGEKLLGGGIIERAVN